MVLKLSRTISKDKTRLVVKKERVHEIKHSLEMAEHNVRCPVLRGL